KRSVEPQRTRTEEELPEREGASMSEAERMDLSQYNSRLASSSGSESDEEGSRDDISMSNPRKYDPAADLSLSSSGSEESDDSVPATAVKTGKATTKKQEQPSSTTFLPS